MKTTDQERAAKLGHEFAVVDDQARRSDHLSELVERVGVDPGRLAGLASREVIAVALDQRPAVVAPGFDQVDLVGHVGAVVAREDAPVLGDVEGEWIAQPVREHG
jgi:hypothetical protein